MLDGNISQLKRLIAKPASSGAPTGTKAKDDYALSKLLQLLENERTEIKQPPKNSTGSTDKASKPE